MSKYDDYPLHPLCGVPDQILEVARAVLRGAAEWGDISHELVEPIADAVVLELGIAGYITWEV